MCRSIQAIVHFKPVLISTCGCQPSLVRALLLSEISRIVPAAERLDPSQVGVATRFFEVEGRLRLHDTEVRERSLVQRNGLGVTTVWRGPRTLP